MASVWAREHPANFRVLPSPHPRLFYSWKWFLTSYSPYPSYEPNFKSLASTAGKKIRGSQNFWSVLQAHTPPNLVLKVVSACYSSNPSRVPNLKSLTLTVAEISRSQNCLNVNAKNVHFWRILSDPVTGFLVPTFSIHFVPRTVGSRSIGTAYPSYVPNFKSNLCFNVMQNLGIWGGSWGGVKILSSKVPYLKSPTHILVFT